MTTNTLSPAGFSPQEYEDRLAAVRQTMADQDWAALLLTGPENVYYLSGLNHQGHFAFTALVVPADGTPVLLARAMEQTTVAVQVSGCEFVGYADDADTGAVCADTVRRAAPAAARVGVELATMSFPPQLWQRVRGNLPDVRWADASQAMQTTRSVKSPAEIETMRQAARLSDAGMQAGIAVAGDGVPPSHVVAEAYRALLVAGSDYPAMPPLVRPTDALLQEHVTGSHRPLRPGQGLLLELSASVARYHAPLTRLVHAGSIPKRTHESAELATAGLEAVRGALRPGTTAADVYASWQRVVDDGLGHERYRRHHCGYSVGIGFPPGWLGGAAPVGLRSGSGLAVRTGMSFHVLSWILGQDLPDYAVSDTVLVTDDGGVLLTDTPRGPRLVG